MAADEDPFEILGVDPTADETDIRRAYLSLVREHGPQTDPVAYQRLRRAFVAACRMARVRDGTSTDEGVNGASGPASGTGDAILDPAVEAVITAVESKRLWAAVERTLARDWRERVRGERPLMEATVRLGCATIWTAPEAFERLEEAHGDVLAGYEWTFCAGTLPRMRVLTPHWLALKAFREVDPWLEELLSYGIASGPTFRQGLAQRILEQAVSRPKVLFRQLETIASMSFSLVELIGFSARELPYDLGIELPEDRIDIDAEAEAVEAAFPWIRAAVIVPAVAGLVALAGRRRWGAAAVAGGVGIYREAYYRVAYRHWLRPRLLEVCLAHDLRPDALPGWARSQSMTSRARPYDSILAEDPVLSAAFDLVRFARAMATH